MTATHHQLLVVPRPRRPLRRQRRSRQSTGIHRDAVPPESDVTNQLRHLTRPKPFLSGSPAPRCSSRRRRGGNPIAEAQPARRPVGEAHHPWPLVSVALAQRRPRLVIDPLARTIAVAGGRQRALRHTSSRAPKGKARSIVGQLGRREQLAAGADLPGQSGRRERRSAADLNGRSPGSDRSVSTTTGGRSGPSVGPQRRGTGGHALHVGLDRWTARRNGAAALLVRLMTTSPPSRSRTPSTRPAEHRRRALPRSPPRALEAEGDDRRDLRQFAVRHVSVDDAAADLGVLRRDDPLHRFAHVRHRSAASARRLSPRQRKAGAPRGAPASPTVYRTDSVLQRVSPAFPVRTRTTASNSMTRPCRHRSCRWKPMTMASTTSST